MRTLIIIFFFFIGLTSFGQFVTEEKMLIAKGDTLCGTLVSPAKFKKNAAVLLLQAGSGPTDRNGNSPLGITANSYRLLAEALAEKNISCLLMDKRGIAKSAAAGKSEKDLRFGMYADDLVLWTAMLKQDKRFKKLIIAGHSEGSLVGMIAAQKAAPDAYISLEGAGQRIDKILVMQFRKQLPKAAPIVDSLLTRMRSGQKLDTVPPYLMSIFRPSVQPYMVSWINYDPCEEIKKISCPVLIIQGSTDVQTTEAEGDLLKSCAPKAEYVLLTGMNHILKDAPQDMQKNIGTYSDPSLPISAGLSEAIVRFISKLR